MTLPSAQIKSPALMSALISMVAGVLLATWLPKHSSIEQGLWAASAFFFVASASLYFWGKRRLVSLIPISAFACLWLFVFFSTALRAYTTLAPPIAKHWKPGDEIIVAGYVASTAEQSSSATRFSVTTRAVLVENQWQPFSSDVQVSSATEMIRRSDLVLMRGSIQRTRPKRNPAGFDERRFLARRGIHYTLRADTLSILGASLSFRSYLDKVVALARSNVYAALEQYVESPRCRAVLEALIAGNRRAIDEHTLDDFKETGLLHVLAVSGLHVMLVGMTVYHLLRPILLRFRFSWRTAERLRTCITSGILLAYMLIAGASASVIRAVIMAAVTITASFVQRPYFPLHALSVAAAILLLIDPLYLVDAGFQLSFAAVASILLVVPLLHRLFPQIDSAPQAIRGVFASCSVSAAATLATLPILLFHFGTASFAGLLLNLPAVPLTTAALSSGLLMLIASFLCPPAADILGHASSFIIDTLLFIVEIGAAYFDGLSFRTDPFTPAMFALLLVGGWVIVVSIRLRKWSYVSLIAPVMGAGFLLSALVGPRLPSIDVIYFDVGHGDAAFIRFPNHRSMLIDTGNRTRYSDSGRRVILPFLQRYGISTLDAVVISHPHADHYGGLTSLLEEVPVRRIFVNPSDTDAESFGALMDRAISEDIAVDTLTAGDTLDLDASTRFRVLSPSTTFAQPASINNASLIVQLQYGDTSFLFLGDAEHQAEKLLVSRFSDMLTADVVKVGHHGSRTSSTPALLTALTANSPAMRALVSTGTHDIYGLPDEGVIESWQRTADSVHITAISGALWLTSDGTTVHNKRW